LSKICPPISNYKIQKVLNEGKPVDDSVISSLFKISNKGVFEFVRQSKILF
jgi:hypothetical protein